MYQSTWSILIVMSCVPCARATEGSVQFGAEGIPSAAPIGGGEGYRRVIEKPPSVVRTAKELLAALRIAKPGSVVYVDDAAEIDMGARFETRIPAGVTLASGRGVGDSKGGLIFSDYNEEVWNRARTRSVSLFTTGGKGVRITGVRLRGGVLQYPARRSYFSTRGVQCQHSDLEVDNCELAGFSHAGIYVRSEKAHIHHNAIHRCCGQGLGYGVGIDVGEALIEANYFTHCRHAIAGTGRAGCRYEARYNIFSGKMYSHCCDMHGGKDRGERQNFAGDWLRIHHNSFHTGWLPIKIRGTPRRNSTIEANWFAQQPYLGRAVYYRDATSNVTIGKNAYGKDRNIR